MLLIHLQVKVRRQRTEKISLLKMQTQLKHSQIHLLMLLQQHRIRQMFHLEKLQLKQDLLGKVLLKRRQKKMMLQFFV